MKQLAFRFLPLLIAFASVGCASQAEMMRQQEIIGQQIRDIDSLRIMQRHLLEQIRILSDSLQFVDDIRTGQYYRNMLSLRDRITRLEYDLKVGRDGITIATLLADDLFSPASADLTTAGRQLLDQLADEIATNFPDHMLYVEGHADSLALGPSLEERYASNWGLSAMRAAAVVDYLIAQHELGDDRIAVVGYGGARPAAPNETREGRRINRRIRVSAHPL